MYEVSFMPIKYFYSIVYCLLRLGQNYVNNQCFVSCPDKKFVCANSAFSFSLF